VVVLGFRHVVLFRQAVLSFDKDLARPQTSSRLSPDQIRPTLGPRGVIPTKARAFHEGPTGWRLAVIAEHARGTSWSVLVDIDADDVSERLEHLQAYPLDLDAVGHGMSGRFTSVAAK
jgi:hypothetical protein